MVAGKAPLRPALAAAIWVHCSAVCWAAKGKSEIDSADLLNAGLAFLQSKQEGSSNMESLVKAFVATTSMGESEHRAQSGQLVANAVLQMLTQAGKK